MRNLVRIAILLIGGAGLCTTSLAMGHAKPKPAGFPAGFRWCVATAAHQIEGGNTNNDWWLWEQVPGKTRARSGAADDHWNRVDQDIGLLKDLGVSTYRFSIEWSRIEPKEGQWDLDAVAHYQLELAKLRAAGIEPMVTLLHFTLPAWIAADGGWTAPRMPEVFARFAAFAVSEIGPDVRDWITLNEPVVQLFNGYAIGIFPPGIKGGVAATIPPMLGMLKAHAAAYHAMHDVAARAGHTPIRVGVAHHLRPFDPPSQWHFLDGWAAGKFSQAFNWAFSTAIETGTLKFDMPTAPHVDQPILDLAGTQDFIGVNYYSRDIVRVTLSGKFSLGTPKKSEKTDLGWEIYPEGFYRVLKGAAEHFPGKPIFVTENGIADATDTKRAAFIDSHLAEVKRAIDDGIPVEGYCHWSLLDNFEWAEGFGPRFGLYQVDYATQTRTPRASALRYAEIIRNNSL